MPGTPGHLIRRFIDVATSAPLAPQERNAIERVLTPELAEIFFEQPPHDQRHGLHASLVIRSLQVNAHRDLVIAALLHDVGKRHARLGLVGRSVASIFIMLGISLPDRFARYRDHGEIAAVELEERGAPPLAVKFARHHHGERPDSIPAQEWDLLQLADQPPKTW